MSVREHETIVHTLTEPIYEQENLVPFPQSVKRDFCLWFQKLNLFGVDGSYFYQLHLPDK